MLIDSLMHCTLLRSADGMYQDAGSITSLLTLVEPGNKVSGTSGKCVTMMTKSRMQSPVPND